MKRKRKFHDPKPKVNNDKKLDNNMELEAVCGSGGYR